MAYYSNITYPYQQSDSSAAGGRGSVSEELAAIKADIAYLYSYKMKTENPVFTGNISGDSGTIPVLHGPVKLCDGDLSICCNLCANDIKTNGSLNTENIVNLNNITVKPNSTLSINGSTSIINGDLTVPNEHVTGQSVVNCLSVTDVECGIHNAGPYFLNSSTVQESGYTTVDAAIKNMSADAGDIDSIRVYPYCCTLFASCTKFPIVYGSNEDYTTNYQNIAIDKTQYYCKPENKLYLSNIQTGNINAIDTISSNNLTSNSLTVNGNITSDNLNVIGAITSNSITSNSLSTCGISVDGDISSNNLDTSGNICATGLVCANYFTAICNSGLSLCNCSTGGRLWLGDSSIMIGQQISWEGPNCRNVAIGACDTAAYGLASIAIGSCAITGYCLSTAIGNNAHVYSAESIAIGNNSYACDLRNIAIGPYARTTNTNSIAMGYNARASGAVSIAIGSNAYSTESDGIAIGDGASVFACCGWTIKKHFRHGLSGELIMCNQFNQATKRCDFYKALMAVFGSTNKLWFIGLEVDINTTNDWLWGGSIEGYLNSNNELIYHHIGDDWHSFSGSCTDNFPYFSDKGKLMHITYSTL